MNFNLPGGGLGRGRVWRSQAWVGGQSSKPWVGTLNPGSSSAALGGAGRAPAGGAVGTCSWAGGSDLPYMQQRFIWDSSDDSMGDISLPLPSPPPLQQQQRLVTSSPSARGASKAFDDLKLHNGSLEPSCSLYVPRRLALFRLQVHSVKMIRIAPAGVVIRLRWKSRFAVL